MPVAKTVSTFPPSPSAGSVSSIRVSGEFPRASSPTLRPDAERSLDDYDPEADLVAPMSIRTSVMQLLWICGDCGEHYSRAQTCPVQCDACGAPQQHFYAPIED